MKRAWEGKTRSRRSYEASSDSDRGGWSFRARHVVVDGAASAADVAVGATVAAPTVAGADVGMGETTDGWGEGLAVAAALTASAVA